MPARSIRWHLFQVLLVTIVPVGIFAAALLYLHWQAQERERERSQVQSVRLLAAAVDNALDSSAQRLSIFAGLWAAQSAGDAVMHAQARAALASNADWSTIVAFRADGSAVFRADEPFGAPLPRMKLIDQWRPLLTGERMLVTDVFTAPMRGQKAVAIGVPVMRGDKVTHVLIATLNLRWFDELLAKQSAAAGGIAGIFDRQWKFVARSAEGDARRGTDGAQALIDDMHRSPEGIGRYTALNGTGVYTSWTRSRHGWWLALATPSAPMESTFWTYLGALAALWAAIMAAGIAYAVIKGRHIAQALISVEGRAAELAAARTLGPLPASRVEEVSRALRALEKASETLQASMQTEQKARAAAEAANRAKDEFLAMLGHELRNPLAAVWSAVEVIRSPRRTAHHLDFAAGVIERQSRHLKRLIDDLLDVGRLITGKVKLERSPLDLAAAVRHVVTALETAGRLVQRRVETDLAPAWMDGDQTRVEQIVTNLLANAAAHTAPGGTINVRVAHEGGEAVLEVRDDGRGIAPEHLERVFELFFQADASVDRAAGGLGIGLTIVQRLSGLHGGTVSVHSAGKGKGAAFVVRFPAIAAKAPSGQHLAALRAVVPQTVLVIEDQVDQREGLRVALELQGYTVLQARDARIGLEMLREHVPPVAIVDIGLPGMNGYEFARAARTATEHRVLLVALTGYGGAEDQQRAREAGFDRHLTKPVGMDDLLDVLGRASVPAPGQQKIA